MNYTSLLVEKEGNIVIVKINRPEALNAINVSVMSELDHFFGQPENAGPDIYGVIITGSGEKAFVAGADIKGLQRLTPSEGTDLASYGQRVFDKIESFPRPVIAAVNGFALGGGCELAMACHFRIASENAKFGQPEVNLGLIPGYGGTQRLPLLVGKGKAMELLMTGDMVDARAALALGLVNYVVPGEELIRKCIDILNKIGTKAPLAVSHIIHCVNATFDHNLKAGLEQEAKIFGDSMGTNDFKEGVSAFIEKRRADFKGN